MSTVKKLLRKKTDGTAETCDIGADALNVTMADGRTAEAAITALDNKNVWTSSNIAENSPGTNWVAASNSVAITGTQNTAISAGLSYSSANINGTLSLLAATASANINGGMSVIMGGYGHTLEGDRAVILGGWANTAHSYNTVVGKYNIEPKASNFSSNSGDLFIVGNGVTGNGTDIRSNAFRVDANGACYAGTAINATGAGYGHVVEWLDGNPDGEDRRGYFVTLVGDKIKIFDPETDTFIFGIVSDKDHVSFIANNHADQWHNKFKRDVYGGLLTEHITWDDEYKDIEVTDPETGETKTETVKINSAGEGDTYILNEGFDPDEKYIPRLNRPEWDVVEHDGFLIANDDGTCTAGSLCTVNANGIATVNPDGNEKFTYYVMKRLDDTHIQIYK